jgi:hypothetical protein
MLRTLNTAIRPISTNATILLLPEVRSAAMKTRSIAGSKIFE